jgi:hypothetical protein
MRRVVLDIAGFLSLLLCLWLIYSWVRSYFPTHMHLESVDGALAILSWEGLIPVDPQFENFNPDSREKFVGIRTLLDSMSHDAEWQLLGFRSVRGGGIFRGVTYHIFAIPYWIIVPPAAVLPILWLRVRRRQRMRAQSGHCLACGYDLRESKDKCPECGVAVKSVAS